MKYACFALFLPLYLPFPHCRSLHKETNKQNKEESPISERHDCMNVLKIDKRLSNDDDDDNDNDRPKKKENARNAMPQRQENGEIYRPQNNN